MMRRSIFVAAVILVASLVALVAPEAWAVERTFAGSVQADYHFVPTAREANARFLGFDGFTLEAAVKLTVDFSEHFSANVKVCYGCHGFEMDMAYLDYRVADALNFRFGRFSPSFGAFNIRHDPANHRLSDKPLPYDMGRMLRWRGWNGSVLPSPFPDNGLEVNGAVALGEAATIDYAAYAVAGFRAGEAPLDVDFTLSRQSFYVDNNGRPTVGGRLALTVRLGDESDATAGASTMHGTYDPSNSLAYTIVGGDLSLRVSRTNVRFEYLARRTEMDTSDPTRLRYVVIDDFFVKHGAYAEIEQPITSMLDAIARVDGMLWTGNVPASAATSPDGGLHHKSSIARFTLGTTISLDRSLRLKTSASYWRFNDEDGQGKEVALGFHLGAVGSF
jgi:hypothetical protein